MPKASEMSVRRTVERCGMTFHPLPFFMAWVIIGFQGKEIGDKQRKLRHRLMLD